MAIIYGKNTAIDYAAGNLASFGKSYSRMGAAPLDMTEVWYDKTALEEYASYLGTLNEDGSYDTSSVVSYVGQRVVYVDEKTGTVYNYAIQLDGSLKEIGKDVLGIDKLTQNDDGKYPQVRWVYNSEEDEVGHAEIVWATITVPEQVDYTVTVSTDNVENTNFKHYVFTQCNKEIAHIDIPKDLVVSSGEVVVATDDDKALDSTVVVGDTYIKLTIANQTKPLYIAAKALIDIYTPADTDTVDMTITGTEIKADVKVSKEADNALIIKDDGLYVEVPEAPEIPEIVIGTKLNVPITDANAETTEVVAFLEAEGHTITPSVIEVVTKGAWDKINNAGEGQTAVRLISQSEIEKLAKLNLDNGEITISGSVNASQVKDLYDTVVNIVKGSTSDLDPDTEGDQLGLGIEKGAQVNKIETILLPDGALAINDKQINIPAFVEGKYGAIKGAELSNGESVANLVYANNGVGEVKKISTDTLVNGAEELILNGGNAGLAKA